MSVKYDFGYEISADSSYAWAAEHIMKNSRVLEIGPSIGKLCRYLTQEKDCLVDIIEYDEAAGNKAKRFANLSAIGPIKGSIERKEWKAFFSTGEYDYIIIQDVLEHLHNPDHVLESIYDYLKPDGKLILSVPNIAHNSVLLSLLNDDFTYKDLGLLDNTHIHFYTYSTLRRDLERHGYSIAVQDACLLPPGANEINFDYDDISNPLSKELRIRQNGDAYQFFIVADKNIKRVPLHALELQGISCRQYLPLMHMQVNRDNEFHIVETIQLKDTFAFEVNIDILLNEYHLMDRMLFSPMRAYCILADLEVIGDVSGNLELVECNGVRFETEWVFEHENPMFIVDLREKKDTKVTIKYRVSSFDDQLHVSLAGRSAIKTQKKEQLEQSERDYREVVRQLKKRQQQLEKDVESVTKDLQEEKSLRVEFQNELLEAKAEIWMISKSLQERAEELLITKESLLKRTEELQVTAIAYQNTLNSRSWRITKPLRFLFGKRK